MEMTILGASSVIGSRLTELILQKGWHPRLVVRNSIGSRLMRYNNLEIVRINFEDVASINQAIKSSDVVINCIIDKSFYKGNREKIKSNIKITNNIITASSQNKIKKIIHLSSIVVLPPKITQSTINNPFKYSQENDWYTKAKIETEKLFIKRSLELKNICIIRPAIVYGPLLPWSMLALSKSECSTIYLPETNFSSCYAIHIDDLCQLIIHLSEMNGGVPKLIYGVNSEETKWSDFYFKHAKAANIESKIKFLPITRLKALINENDKKNSLRRIFAWMVSSPFIEYLPRIKFIRALGRIIKDKINLEKNEQIIQGGFKKGFILPTKYELELYQSNAKFNAALNGESIGFHYKVNFQDGCKNTAQWWNYKIGVISSRDWEEIKLAQKQT